MSMYTGTYVGVEYGAHKGSIGRVVDTLARYPDVDAIFVLQFDERKKTVQIHGQNLSHLPGYKGETKYVFNRAPKKS